jgi:recombination protein RecA
VIDRIRLPTSPRSQYFQSDDAIAFFSTGCKTLDLALGGGWAAQRVINIVGDKSTGKTLLAIEGAANFANTFPKGRIRYRESEMAFQMDYARTLGMPLQQVDFGPGMLDTVEDLFEDLTKCARAARHPELFIVDSLDALSSRAEQNRDIDASSFGGEKAKKMSELFRRLIRCLSDHTTLMIISQVRDKIGVTFGRKITRTGGRALDFYASQVLYLAQAGTVRKTIKKIERVTGVQIKARVDKNKVGFPFREAQFDVLFGYGIDDRKACLSWLKDIGDTAAASDNLSALHRRVEQRWWQIEDSFLPKQSKYGRNGARQ